jgi:hypothetical protein
LNEINEVMEQFFASLMNQKAELQHQVIHYRKHNSFETDSEVLHQRIEYLRQTRRKLEMGTRRAQAQVNAVAKINVTNPSEVLYQRIEYLRQTRITLEMKILQAQKPKLLPKWTCEESDSGKASAEFEFPTPDEVRLQIHISDLSAELRYS